ncbi:J domain-containing protein [Desulfonatronospira sp.]
MSRRELTRIYRRRALKMHPDKGGDHEEFIRLNEAYQTLLKKIRPGT